MPQSDAIAFGKYRLVELLGRGGMAEVWRAQTEGPGGFTRTVVIKRILGAYARDARFVDLFFREARVSARLHHANVAQVFDFGEVGGEWFLAMEYLDGRDLGGLIATLNGPLPVGLGAFVVRELCRALAYVHSASDDDGAPLGLVHRDVSLSNVMLCFDGAVKLLDFGVAKAVNVMTVGIATPQTLVGKPSYMAPELLAGRRIDHRADVYGAGIVLYEALTGRRLFFGELEQLLDHNERAQPLPPPSRTNPRVDVALDRIFRRGAMTKCWSLSNSTAFRCLPS